MLPDYKKQTDDTKPMNTITCRHIPSDRNTSVGNGRRSAIRYRSTFCVVIRLFVTIAALAQPLTAGAADPAEIASRYSDLCSVCHGDRGQGAMHAQQGMIPAPRNFTDPAFASTMTREYMIDVIQNGKPGTAMIAWKSTINAEETAELADYIIDNFAASSSEPGNVAEHESKSVKSEAALTYQESCSVCHGDDGKGAVWGQQSLAMPPRDFTTDAARRELTRDRMIVSVTFGRPGSPMPGFDTQLNSDQVEAIVDYIRARFMLPETGNVSGISTSPGGGQTGNPVASGIYHEQPYPDGLNGNFARGRAFYMANCVTCHGADGTGDGPRAYFIFPRPRNFLEQATQEILNRPTLFRGIKTGVIGREMPAWGKVMDDQSIVDISEYVYLEFIRKDTVRQ